MKKKFLKAFLFTVAMATVSGTFVSCKDYDDDIKDLQEQIDQKALISDVTSLQSSLQTALTNAQSALTAAQAAQKAADAAQATATSAEGEADINAMNIMTLEKKVAALEEAMKEVENLKAEIEAASAEQMAALDEKFKTLETKVNEMVGTMITSIELYYADNTDCGIRPLTSYTATEVDNTFKSVTFTKGKVVTYDAEPVIVRVSPTNADLTSASIKLINSQGAALNQVTTTAKAYTGLITTRTAGNGLWTLTTKLNADLDIKAFNAAVYTKNKAGETVQVRFAYAVSNTDDADRMAVTAYDMVIGSKEATPCEDLEYTVNKTDLKNIHNRYASTEYAWKSGLANEKRTAIASDKSNVVTDTSDDRSAKSIMRVEAGADIAIALTEHNGEKIKGFYVVLDTDYAGTGYGTDDIKEPSVSEINSWKSYSYENLDTYFEGKEGTIRVNNLNNVVSDIIGFRVFAVNVNGTLIDPDGKAFYVVVANKTAGLNIAGEATISKKGADFVTDYIAIDKDVVKGYDIATPTTWTDSDKDGNLFTVTFYSDNKGTVASKLSDARYAKLTIPYADATKYTDGGTFTQSVVVSKSAATGADQLLINASVTKKMPTAAPAGFIAKDKQIVDGVWTVYLANNKVYADANTINYWYNPVATSGIKGLENAFNGLNVNGTYDENYVFTFANTVKDGDKGYVKALNVTAANKYFLDVPKDLIDGKTTHATTVYYNYGKISSVKDATTQQYTDAYMKVSEFNTVYACWHMAAYDWAWTDITAKDKDGKEYVVTPATKAVTYGTYDQYINLNTITVKNSYSGDFAGKLSTLVDNLLLKYESAKLVSNATGVEEYFSCATSIDSEKGILLTPLKYTSDANPTAAVPSKLTLVFSDLFGHKLTVEMEMTVNKK